MGEPGPKQSLTAEILLVREILRRLETYLNDAEYVARSQDLQRIVNLIYGGTRTLAHLLTRPAGSQTIDPDWLRETLETLSKDYDIEL